MAAVSAVQSKTVAGKIAGVDLTNDGSLVAVALERSDGGTSIQVYRCSDLELQAEYAPKVNAGRGVAFVADDSCLAFVTHTHAGATLYLVDEGAPQKIGEYPARQAEQLVRDHTGARLGIVGDSFLVWSSEGHAVPLNKDDEPVLEQIKTLKKSTDPKDKKKATDLENTIREKVKGGANARNAQLDHDTPVSQHWEKLGGNNTTQEEREKFYNDLTKLNRVICSGCNNERDTGNYVPEVGPSSEPRARSFRVTDDDELHTA